MGSDSVSISQDAKTDRVESDDSPMMAEIQKKIENRKKNRNYKHSNQFIKDRLDFKKGNNSISDYDSDDEKEQAKPVLKSLQSCIAEARQAAQ